MSTTNTALIVIDAQESFRHRPYWSERDYALFVEKVQALIDGARSRGIPIVQVFHVEDSGAFALESGWVTTLAEISITPDVVFSQAEPQCTDRQWSGRVAGPARDSTSDHCRNPHRAMLRDHDSPRIRYRIPGGLRDGSNADVHDDRFQTGGRGVRRRSRPARNSFSTAVLRESRRWSRRCSMR